MSDPDLWSSDPLRRAAAEVREQNAQNAKKSDAPINATSSNSADTEALETLTSATLTTVETALRASDAVNSLSEENKQIISRSVTVAAIVLAPMILFSTTTHYYDKLVGNYDVNKYPSIAVTFNNDNRSFVAKHPKPSRAQKLSMDLCHTNSGLFTSCFKRVKATKSGYPVCLAYTYGRVNSARFEHERNGYSIVLDERPNGVNPILKQCSTAECQLNAGIACNFN